MTSFAGFDLGAHVAHGVLISADGALVDARVFERREVEAAGRWATAAARVAIDAPLGPSAGAHAADEALSPKFRLARCAEIDLGRSFGIWVPWATPMREPAPWMAHGFELAAAVGAERAIEVYPHAGFRVLDARRLPPKLTVPGIRRRVEILGRMGFSRAGLEAWTHDAIDAAMAALIARDVGLGRAVLAGCGHDGSTIALPAGALRNTPMAEGERPLDHD